MQRTTTTVRSCEPPVCSIRDAKGLALTRLARRGSCPNAACPCPSAPRSGVSCGLDPFGGSQTGSGAHWAGQDIADRNLEAGVEELHADGHQTVRWARRQNGAPPEVATLLLRDITAAGSRSADRLRSSEVRPPMVARSESMSGTRRPVPVANPKARVRRFEGMARRCRRVGNPVPSSSRSV